MIGNPQQRRQARRKALQALYQWDLAGEEVQEIDAQFLAYQDMSRADVGYFQVLLRGVVASVAETDALLAPHLDRALTQLDPIERNVLRIAAFELRERLEVPFRVVINEAVELCKAFGAEQGHKYVNGVLDRIARDLRSHELAAAGGAR